MLRELACACFAILTAGSLSACASTVRANAPPSGVLYHGFTLIDPVDARVIPDAHLLVEGGRITAVGSGPWTGAPAVREVELVGRYALPGLIDGHAHITSGPHSVEVVDGAPVVTIPSVDSITRFNAAVALAFGVTTVRNPGGDPVANARYDAMVRSGAWHGPEALHAGAVIQPPPFGGDAFAYPRTEAQWQAEAQRQARLGMRYFKLYTGLSADELATGIRVAHENGLKAIAHLDTVSWTQAARLGIDGLEHALPTSADLLEPAQREVYLAERGADARHLFRWFELAEFDGPLMQGMFGELARRGVIVNTTLGVNEITYNSDRLDVVLAPEDRIYIHPQNLEALRSFLPVMSDEDHRRARAVMPKVLEFARRLHEAGVPILIGTDGNGGGPAYGRELQLHVQAGIDAWDVLRLATSGAAARLGVGDRTGRIAAGMEADVVFLRSSPLTDLRRVRDVDLVLTDGRAFSAEELLKSVNPMTRPGGTADEQVTTGATTPPNQH